MLTQVRSTPLPRSTHRWPGSASGERSLGHSPESPLSVRRHCKLGIREDYRVLLFLSFIESKVCVMCVGLSVITPIRFHPLCIVYSSLFASVNKKGARTQRSFLLQLSCICHHAVGQSSSELHTLFPTPLLVEIGMLKGATKVVDQEEEAEEEEENWTAVMQRIPL